MPLKGMPLTNSAPTTKTIPVRRYVRGAGGNAVRNLEVVDDYAHHKGQQMHSFFAGYGRGERVKLAVAMVDLAGRVLPPVPLPESVLPEVTLNDGTETWGLTKNNLTLGRYTLQAMGLSVSGLRLKDSLLRGGRGELLYSGFHILRADVPPRKKHRGVLLPTSWVAPTTGLPAGEENCFYLTPSLRTVYADAYTTEGRPGSHLVADGPSPKLYYGPGTPGSGLRMTASRPHYQTYHSPDLLIEGRAETADAASQLRLAFYAKATSATERPVGHATDATVAEHRYSKIYGATGAIFAAKPHRPKVGETAPVQLSKLITGGIMGKKNASDEAPALDSENPLAVLYAQFQTSRSGSGGPSDIQVRWQAGSSIVKTGWESVDDNSYTSDRNVAVVEWLGADTDVNEETTEQLLTYIPTGHFQPLTEAVLADVPAEGTGAEKVYRFDGIEVWGGDTYLNFTDLAVLSPGWGDAGRATDAAEGIIIPLESKYNVALRAGRGLARDGFYPSAVAFGDSSLVHLTGGIAPQQPERWDYNRCLVRRETLSRFQPLPRRVVPQPERPNDIYRSEQKSYGETADDFRRFLPLNMVSTNAAFGPAVALEPLFGGLYLWQERAFGRIPMSEVTTTATSSGELVTGTGRDMADVQYIAENVGLQQPAARTNTGRAVYFWDSRAGAFYRHSQAGLDTISLRGYTATLRKAAGRRAVVGYRPDLGQVLLALPGSGGACHAYLETVDAWEGALPGVPELWLSDGLRLWGLRPNYPQLYRQGAGVRQVWLGAAYEARLEFVIAPGGRQPFIYHNARLLGSQALAAAALTLTYSDESGTSAVLLRTDPRIRFEGKALRLPLRSGPVRLMGRMLRAVLTVAAPTDPAQGGPNLLVTAHETLLNPQ